MRLYQVFLLLFVLFASTCASDNDPIDDLLHSPALHAQKAGHGGNGSQEQHGGHHGVRLASWRWNEYGAILLFILMIILAAVLKMVFHHTGFLARMVPESCILILCGILIGVIVYYGFGEHGLAYFPNFTADLFFNVLLPPIILDSSYALYDRDFLSNIGSVLLYAVVGTLFNVFAIGGLLELLYYVGAMGDSFVEPLDGISCLIFSSLISAVDPVAVLAIFEEVGVNMQLYFLVFGESLLNDGVTVVLYNTMVSLAGQEHIEDTQYVLAILSFFTVVFGGLAIGMLIGLFSAYILKQTDDVRVIQPLMIFATAYLSFITAECLHWSGIISLIGCGIMQKRYAFVNISQKSYTTVKYGIKTVASLCDCIIFLFLGKVTITNKLEWHTEFIIWTVVLCFLIRFIGVFFLTWLVNLRRLKPISYKEQFIMAYGGLRGAVGFSLVTILDNDHPFKAIFVTATLTMIFFTVFLQGGTIKFFVSKLHIQRKSHEAKSMSKDVNLMAIDHVMAGVESVAGLHSQYSVIEAMRNVDEKFLRRLLVREGAEDPLALRCHKISLADHYARLYGPAVNAHHQFQRVEGANVVVRTRNRSGAESNSSLHKELERAYSNTPFFRYSLSTHGRHRNDHSPDRIRKELNSHLEERTHHVARRLSISLARTLSAPEGSSSATLNADNGNGNSNVPARHLDPGRYHLMRQQTNLTAGAIKRHYDATFGSQRRRRGSSIDDIAEV